MSEQPYDQSDQAQLLRDQAAQRERERAEQPAPAEGTANESPDPTPTTTPGQTGNTSAPESGPGPYQTDQQVPPAFSADQPTTLDAVPPGPVVDTEAPTDQTGVIQAVSTSSDIMVRLRDVVAHVENFLARHPELRVLEADIKSGIATIERHPAPVAPAASNTADQQAASES